MALSALDFPTDIRWERVCASLDMLDPTGCDETAPPRWQSSAAIFRFVPEEEYQVYPDRRIVYFKVTCTIGSYQPRTDEVEGVMRAGALTVGETQDLARKLKSFAPCNGAILQVSVTPKEDGVALEDYPYIADVQPKQRALYEQTTDSNEVASRSLENLNITKGGGSSQSQEVLDIDKGTSVSGQASASGSYAGVGAGVGLGGSYSRSGEWGTKTLGQQDRSRVETTDSVREARETSSHTTQLSQMYTLLQAYHVGTNRVMFYVSPRPHVLEEPTGFIRGPRRIDGVQEFFLIVNQAAGQQLPCLSVRLDTGHLTVLETYEYDTSEAPKELSVNVTSFPPGELDPNKSPAGEGGDPFFSLNYDCFDAPPDVVQASATAPAGYVVDKVTDIGPVEVSSGSADVVIDPPPPADGRSVTLTGKAMGHACYRNGTGDAANTAALVNLGSTFGGPLGTLGGGIAAATGSDAPGFEEVKNFAIGYARRTVRIHWRSETRSKKTGEKQVLLVTTRVLCCCGEASTPPKLVGVVPVEIDVELERPPRPGTAATDGDRTNVARPPAPSGTTTDERPMSARSANELGALAFAETARVAAGIVNAADAPALDGDLAFARVTEFALGLPRFARVLARPAGTIDGLSAAAEKRLVDMALPDSPVGVAPSRLALAWAPSSALAERLGIDESEALRLRLAALGLADAPPRRRPARARTERSRKA